MLLNISSVNTELTGHILDMRRIGGEMGDKKGDRKEEGKACVLTIGIGRA